MRKKNNHRIVRGFKKMEKNKPVFQVRKGLISASLFQREVKGSNGPFISSSVALNVSYKKGKEFKQNSLTIVKNNLGAVIDALKEVQAELQ